MTIEIRRSARRYALQKAASIPILVVVGGAFAYVGFFRPEVPWVATPIFALIVWGTVVFIRRAMKQCRTALANDRDWVVRISDDTLTWSSPVPELFSSINLPLSEIDFVQVTTTHRSSGNSSMLRVQHKWHISQNNGERIDIDPQDSGVHPEKVFKALKTQGVEFREISQNM